MILKNNFKEYLINKRSWVNRYLFSIAFLFISLAFISYFNKTLDAQFFSLMLIASILSAIHGGLGPALLVSVIGSAALDALFVDDRTRWFHPFITTLRVLIYFAASFFCATLANLLKKYFSEANDLRYEAEKASKEKDALMTIVAHDLKNPLSVILGYNELLKEKASYDTEILDTIRRNCESSLELINQLQEYAQLGHEEFPLKTEPIDLNLLITSLVDSLKVLAEQKRIKLALELNQSQIFTFGDVGLLGRAIRNLIDNAVKYGYPDTTVTVSCKSKDGKVEVGVSDQGPGIAKDEMEKLFEPFYKTSNRPTGNENSTGLGLAMVKSVAGIHNGKISVNSAKGKGSTFTLTLNSAPLQKV